MQAYLRDTEGDLRELLHWARDVRKTPVWIRLVKGAYWDYETVKAAQEGWPVPVWQRKWESDAAFERCSTFLLENVDWLVPAFGSHNLRSVSHAIAEAERLGVHPKRFEFQMLYGMADAIKGSVQALGHRVRIYTPYGELLPGMAYLVRRLLENTSNDSFLRQGFSDGVPEEVLLRDPNTTGEQMAAASNGTPKAHPSQRPWGLGHHRPERFQNEPLADFALEKNRQVMADALKALKLGGEYPPVIGNKPVNPPSLRRLGQPVAQQADGRPLGPGQRAAGERRRRLLAESLRRHGGTPPLRSGPPCSAGPPT